MHISIQKIAAIFLGTFFALCSISNVTAYTYTEPTGRIALNESLTLSAEPSTFPLWLRYGGRYYAELYLENAQGVPDVSHDKTLMLEVQIDIARKGRLLKSETKLITFAPGQRNQTLFWARAPFDLPQRTNLDMTVRLTGVADQPVPDTQALRLQVTRKFEFAPIFR